MTSNANKAVAWCTAGSAACDAGDFAYALQCFDNAAGLDPSDPGIDYERGVTLERMEKPKEAEAAYRACLQRWPNHDMCLSNLGSILRARDDHAGALVFVDRAVAANEAREEAWFHKGMCHRALGQLGQARDALKRAVQLNRADADDWHWLGVVMQESECWREALVCFAATRTFSKEAPQIAFATHRSGMCGHRAAMSQPRPGRDAYRGATLGLVEPQHRSDVLRVVVRDYTEIGEHLRREGNGAAVAAVREELASLNQAIALGPLP